MGNTKKVILSVAPINATPHHLDANEIIEDVYNCYKAGASMVHLHVRDEEGHLTPDMSFTEEIIAGIRAKCDIVIEVSTGGVSDLSIQERCMPCYSNWVECTSLNVGSVNLGKSCYSNPIDDVKFCVRETLENKKFPEIEVFELGMIHTVKKLDDEFHFKRPILFALVFGHEGEMPATVPAFHFMHDYIEAEFGEGALTSVSADGKRQILWGYTQANRTDWEMMSYALEQGADSIRIGFEDSDYADKGIRVTTNATIVEKAAELIKESGAECMTAAELRELLK